ncbi:MAG: hypothetical protein MZV64_19225 [Ignavibacteriales bacterium]|nr:hypothetical protein [Ignavibacteriales bacterium]
MGPRCRRREPCHGHVGPQGERLRPQPPFGVRSSDGGCALHDRRRSLPASSFAPRAPTGSSPPVSVLIGVLILYNAWGILRGGAGYPARSQAARISTFDRDWSKTF